MVNDQFVVGFALSLFKEVIKVYSVEVIKVYNVEVIKVYNVDRYDDTGYDTFVYRTFVDRNIRRTEHSSNGALT